MVSQSHSTADEVGPISGLEAAPSRVLIIEDEAIVARHIATALTKRGFDVVGRASSGERALAMAQELRPDLVLADVHLVGAWDGIETVAQIQKQHDVAVVYLTAYSDAITLERAVSTNPCGYVVKPFNEAGLRCAVEVALRKHATEREVRNRSQRDDLTGLYNRGGFLTVTTHLRRFAQRQGKAIALMYFDLDGFKAINDDLGHARGDACLKAFAQCLEHTFRKSDVLARLGGDEFAAFVMDPSGDGGTRVLMRLREALRVAFADVAPGYPVDASVGTAIASPHDSLSIEELLERADMAMYVDKRGKAVLGS